jgi:CRP-like cAMP-binding protein
MHEQLKKQLSRYLILNPEEEAEIDHNFRYASLQKGSFIIKPDMQADKVYFLLKGSVRYYHKKSNTRISHWFGFENDFVAPFRSMTSGCPSTEYIQGLENCKMIFINYQDLLHLFYKYHQWERLGRLVVEDFARRALDRVTCFQSLNATQKYLLLLEKEPRIIQRVPLGYISSYLGISQETLSRVRSKVRGF